ncbi:hypothetical protein BDL97_10G083100 [Sphagnum fallax]|nr:hypothetical protein BDL97_10G083100 [Sphagnum fallax]
MVGMLRLLLIPVLTPTNAAGSSSSSFIRSFAAAACHQLKRKKEKNKKRRHDIWQRWRSLSLQAGTDKHVAVEEKKIDSEKQQQCDFQAAALDVSFPTYMIWGANTGVGKTLVSAGLSAAIVCHEGSSQQWRGLEKKSGVEEEKEKELIVRRADLLYVKPVQTGFPADSDARYVFEEVSRVGRLCPQTIPHGLFACNHTLQVSPAVCRSFRDPAAAISATAAWRLREQRCWAADETGMRDLCSSESRLLQGCHTLSSTRNGEDSALPENNVDGGRDGVCQKPTPAQFTCQTMWSWFDPVSPHLAAAKEGSTVSDLMVLNSVQSSLQSLSDGTLRIWEREDKSSDLMRKWALVETAGGVASPGPSGTLQCDLYRPLRLPGVLVGDGKLGGISSTVGAYESLQIRGYDTIAIVLVDSGLCNEQALCQYLKHRIPVFVLPQLPQDPNESLASWFSMAKGIFADLRDTLERAHSDRIKRLVEMPRKASQILWWPFTQHSLVKEGSIAVIDSRCGENFSIFKPELAREAAYSAGRYGHVMFPENVHEPALHCAELLLQGVGQGWAERVFFSDNGSTSIEVAIKMAFRKYATDHGLCDPADSEHGKQQFEVLALKGSYHGDTLGAMDAQAPSAYTGFLQQPWYSGRGLFLKPPTVYLRKGCWHLQLPEANYSDSKTNVEHSWESREEVFDADRDGTMLANMYSESIKKQLALSTTRKGSTSIAALIIEPVIHGAGGMQIVDPLFQRVLVRECQSQLIPTIFDEVLTGCWRLGVESAAELLGCKPDIACYSKLLTGGVVPLGATLASESVFETFMGNSKLDALLHGHSYTAHAIGCASAAISLQYFSNPLRNPNLLPSGRQLKEFWKPELVSEISWHQAVHRVVSLGTIFALELHTSAADSGYASLLSKGLVEGLRHDGIYIRPLGNVVYLMCGPLTNPESCSILLQKLHAQLG